MFFKKNEDDKKILNDLEIKDIVFKDLDNRVSCLESIMFDSAESTLENEDINKMIKQIMLQKIDMLIDLMNSIRSEVNSDTTIDKKISLMETVVDKLVECANNIR